MTAKDASCRSSRKVKMDKAERYIEELVDKVHECEDEMVRMRKMHTEEIAALKLRAQGCPTGGKGSTEFAKIEPM